MPEFNKERFECKVEKGYWTIVYAFSDSYHEPSFIVGFGKITSVSDDQRILGITYLFGSTGHVSFWDRKNVEIFRKEEKEEALKKFCHSQEISFEVLRECLY